MELKKLKEFLEENKNATEIDLSDESLDINCTKEIAKFLKENKNVKKLNLQGCEIGDEGVKHITDSLKTHQNLTELNLEDNKIGDKGAKDIAKMLEVNESLTALNLNYNPIKVIGVKSFCDGLKNNTSLIKLRFNGNDIGNGGAKHFAEMLAVNKNITQLYLGKNGIDDKGAKPLIDSFKKNKTITNLYIRNNKVEDKLINQVDKLMSDNKAFIKKTAKFLVNKFVDKQSTSIDEDRKYLEYYQVADKKLINEYLKEELKSKKDITPDSLEKNIQRYIGKNFMKLAGVSKKSELTKNKNIRDSNGWGKISPFELPELRNKINKFLGNKSLQKIKPSKKFADKVLSERKNKNSDIQR